MQFVQCEDSVGNLVVRGINEKFENYIKSYNTFN